MGEMTNEQPRREKRFEAAERFVSRPAASAIDNPLRKELSDDIISA